MREIKFRAKDRATNQWVYGYPYKSELGNWFILTETSKYHIDNDTFGEYTGIKDIKGREIYEGDIVQIYWGGDYEDKSLKGIITWDNASLKILIHGKEINYYNTFEVEYPFKSYEIIGNIHETSNYDEN